MAIDLNDADETMPMPADPRKWTPPVKEDFKNGAWVPGLDYSVDDMLQGTLSRGRLITEEPGLFDEMNKPAPMPQSPNTSTNKK